MRNPWRGVPSASRLEQLMANCGQWDWGASTFLNSWAANSFDKGETLRAVGKLGSEHLIEDHVQYFLVCILLCWL